MTNFETINELFKYAYAKRWSHHLKFILNKARRYEEQGGDPEEAKEFVYTYEVPHDYLEWINEASVEGSRLFRQAKIKQLTI